MVQGKLHQGAEVCRQIIQQGGRLPIAPIAHYDLGRLLYEWNDLQAAADHCQQGIELNRRGGNVEFLVGGLSALAFVRQAQGQAAAARDALQESQQLLDRHPDIPPGTRLYHLCSRIRVALGQGDLEAAALAAESAPGPEESGSFPDYVTLMLMQARLLLAQGQKAAASEHLARLVGMASQTGWQTTVVQARALQALVASSPDEALTILGEALALAEPLGYVRTFVDSGEPMAELLRQAAAQGVMREYVNELLSAFETPQPPTPVPDQPLVEPLSERELDVLRLLVDGQTNQEIAQTLCVSINTVKTHLKNVYGKLGVNNRRQAAAEAKKLGLVT
jgi:LuxR family maltose regulon positive regulatory protein